MLGTSLALFADLGACHVQKLSVTICVLPAPFRWGATPLLPPISMRWIYFYPRPPSGGRPIQSNMGRRCLHISIHALRVEGDSETNAANSASDAISIHALRVEGDTAFPGRWRSLQYFYPRPPGGGRLAPLPAVCSNNNFYPRPPGGGRHFVSALEPPQVGISIHALRVEGDPDRFKNRVSKSNFYPRPPGGGRL